MAVGVQVRRQDARLLGRHEHDRAGAIAEQHAGAAIVPVEDARIDLGADDERIARQPACHHPVGNGERIDEAGAHRLHVERGSAAGAELRLQDARRRRKDDVGRRRRDDDQVEIVDGASGRRCERFARRGKRKVRRLLAVGGNVPLRECRCACGSTRRSWRRAARARRWSGSVPEDTGPCRRCGYACARSGPGSPSFDGSHVGHFGDPLRDLVEHAVLDFGGGAPQRVARTRTRRRRRGS